MSSRVACIGSDENENNGKQLLPTVYLCFVLGVRKIATYLYTGKEKEEIFHENGASPYRRTVDAVSRERTRTERGGEIFSKTERRRTDVR